MKAGRHCNIVFSGNQYLTSMAECPNKASYQFMDLEKRTAKFFNIPFKMKQDPFNLIGVIGSLQQQRFITSVLQVKSSHINALQAMNLNIAGES